jgi:hypothetical protein
MTYRTKRILETALYSATLIIMVFTFYLRLSNTRTLEILGKTYRTDLVDAAIWTPLAVIFAIKWVREGHAAFQRNVSALKCAGFAVAPASYLALSYSFNTIDPIIFNKEFR